MRLLSNSTEKEFYKDDTPRLSLTWFFNPRCQVRAFATYDVKESDDPGVADYRKIDSGGGLSLNYQF